MNFTDEVIERINQNDVDSVYQMIVKYLCGENYYKTLSVGEKDLLSNLLRKMLTEGVNYAQFNELLLLLDQDRVTEGFFKFCFGKERINLEELRQGFIKFRGFAMLCFGNFRFAYKRLSQKNEKELRGDLKPYYKSTDEILRKLKDRPFKALDIEKIEKKQTWYNGYITKKKWEKETALLGQLLEPEAIISYPLPKNALLSLAHIYKNMGEDIKEVEQKALSNTDIYLTWDYMDVYIATSMRHKWEFEETFDFVNEVFNSRPLNELNLRYFDPTQSQCKNRIDKGLIEGLMLKRARCTIYMAQEIDTMGKDSELAATLAQGKPVIAYVPYIDISQHAKKIRQYPLDFFKQRFLILQAEGILDDENCKAELKNCDPNFEKTIDHFIDELSKYRSSQPFSLWHEKENQFKEKSHFFPKICKLLAVAEHYSYQKRATTLKDVHPLAIQVDLKSGVANGVLVVRSSKQCADLLYKILTNCMNFTIKHVDEKDKGMTVLEEQISECPFRVITDHEKITNSFWNFYLISE